MKRLIFFATILLIGFGSCIKKKEGCTPVDPSAEEAQILAYINARGITAIKHSSGLYYQVTNPGSGPSPTLRSQIYFTYIGRLLNGTVFDQSVSAINSPLSGLIEGWQIGLPLIRKGGKIRLIIPSAYGYGCTGSAGGIPANSVLDFEIDLLDVQ